MAKLQQVEELLGRGKTRAASTPLEQVDTHFAGLAAPESVELALKLSAVIVQDIY